MRKKENYFSFNPKDKLFGFILKFIKTKNIKSILDIGCANGYLMGLIKNLPNVDIIKGIDSDNKFVDGKKVLKGDITKIPFKDRMFDLVIAKDVIEHAPDNIKAIKELIRVSKKYIFISAPAPFTDCAWGDYQHKRPYTKTTLKHIAKDFKLELIKLGSIKRRWPFRIIAKLWMQPIDDIAVYGFFEK